MHLPELYIPALEDKLTADLAIGKVSEKVWWTKSRLGAAGFHNCTKFSMSGQKCHNGTIPTWVRTLEPHKKISCVFSHKQYTYSLYHMSLLAAAFFTLERRKNLGCNNFFSIGTSQRLILISMECVTHSSFWVLLLLENPRVSRPVM